MAALQHLQQTKGGDPMSSGIMKAAMFGSHTLSSDCIRWRVACEPAMSKTIAAFA